MALDAGEVKAAKDSWIEERTERRDRLRGYVPPESNLTAPLSMLSLSFTINNPRPRRLQSQT